MENLSSDSLDESVAHCEGVFSGDVGDSEVERGAAAVTHKEGATRMSSRQVAHALAEPLAELLNNKKYQEYKGNEACQIWTGDLEAGAAVTIGAKRCSAGNGVRPEVLAVVSGDESLDVVASAKRGKTQEECRLGVMRHSARLDDAIDERKRNLPAEVTEKGFEANRTGGGGKDGLPGGDSDELSNIPWPDKTLRPYDTPIVDMDLPAVQAAKLGQVGFGPDTLIVCSPFRRCLQTAGVVARTLGVTGVTVCLEVGERMDKVRKEIAEMATAANRKPSGEIGGETQPVFSYLDHVSMVDALGEGVRLKRVIGNQPPCDESGVEAKQRFIRTISNLRRDHLREGPVLVVAHGDTLDAAGESLASQIVYEGEHMHLKTPFCVSEYGQL